ncbi:MAG TPA: thioredoxin [Anaerolineae bacterium]|nr:thioredoxin [Anaerolineae bacterium]
MDNAKGPVHVNDSDFEQTVLKSEQAVVVDFWAAWCGPCRMIAPYVEELAKEYSGKAVVAKMDTDANPMTPTKYGIMGIPTLIFFKDGKEVDRMVGVPRQPKEILKSKLEAILGAPANTENPVPAKN